MPAYVSAADLKTDEQKRDQWEKLTEVIHALDLKPGSRVADIGTGYGYFASNSFRPSDLAGRCSLKRLTGR
jgi:protein-L-isoaspartate O-methyltransferase